MPHPDISSVEAFKRTPLNAKSIAYIDPASGGTSGIYLSQALEKLGIAAEIKSKLRLVSPPTGQSSPRVGEVVQRGEAEIGIQPVSELIEVAGIDVVGPLPADLQSPDLVYVAGSPATSEQPLPARSRRSGRRPAGEAGGMRDSVHRSDKAFAGFRVSLSGVPIRLIPA